MTNLFRKPAWDDGENGIRLHLRPLGYVNGEPAETRRAWLATVWALVLDRFREHAEGLQRPHDTGGPAHPSGAGDEEDR